MNRHNHIVMATLVAFAVTTASIAQGADPQVSPYAGAPGWAESKTERMAWFKDAKFGMFIHWGLYAPAGGYWPPNPETGKKYPQKYSEWIRTWANVAEPEYGQLTKPLFTPDDGCTEQWAKLAKAAGMKYTVLTTKHHDGYTLFNAKAPYSVKNDVTGSTNISPAGRDLVAEYAESVRSQGLKVGFYYSIIDWQHPHAYPHSRNWPVTANVEHREYVDYMHQHLKQLFTDYGKSDILWADYSNAKYQGSTWRTKELLTELHRLQPQTLVNNRFWNGLQNANGDFFTPEKYIPASGFPGRSFEVCHTMNESFGFSHHDSGWKSGKEVIHMLVDIVSKGGNLLLNVGPDAHGRIPQASVDALLEVGQWLEAHGEAIYGTDASPFSDLAFDGRCTQKTLDDGNTDLYFHVFAPLANGRLKLPVLENEVLDVALMGADSQLELDQTDQGWFVDLPKSTTASVCPVVKLQLKGQARFSRAANLVQQNADRSVMLPADRTSVAGTAIHVLPRAAGRDAAYTSHWYTTDATVTFTFIVHSPGPVQAGGTVTRQPGIYDVFASYATAANSGGTLQLTIGDQTLKAAITPTGGWDRFERKAIGEIRLSDTGETKLVLQAIKVNGQGFMNLKLLELLPQE